MINKKITVNDIGMQGGYIIVDEFQPKTSTFVSQNSNSDRPNYGIVKNIGSEVKLNLSIGDIVMFGRYETAKVFIDDKNYYIIQQDDIIGIIKNN